MPADQPEYQLPAVMARNEETVRRRFWSKLLQNLGRIPFAPDLLAAYYCAVDPQTPAKVKAVLLAALAYFVLPVDMIPDFAVGLGFTDDLTVLLTAIAMVRGHILPEHQSQAQKYFNQQSGQQSDEAR